MATNSINYSTNNINTQINVTGFKSVQSLESGKITVYANGKYCLVRISGSFTVTASGNTTLTTQLSYKPLQQIHNQFNPTSKAASYIQINSNTITFYNAETNTSRNLSCTLFYPY